MAYTVLLFSLNYLCKKVTRVKKTKCNTECGAPLSRFLKCEDYLPLITTETYVAWQHTIKKYAFRSAARAAHYQMKLVKQQMSAPCKWVCLLKVLWVRSAVAVTLERRVHFRETARGTLLPPPHLLLPLLILTPRFLFPWQHMKGSHFIKVITL